ncbi:fungal-specific transcription factor domain-containing protein [Penicillium samsonianum]|uniref:fungal-specific transcription factor domain-containing protein n=1 Tax=Penicillium samsonianum TaxID=1882272 RepID=UPI0025480BDD|nr:fungal-specific transcription factor domain-containing protein [Penicillium samsonianum]KAJ6119011.1 fungal-specific transcription factor domain-containing protein [Penicillium samsonianum]
MADTCHYTTSPSPSVNPVLPPRNDSTLSPVQNATVDESSVPSLRTLPDDDNITNPCNQFFEKRESSLGTPVQRLSQSSFGGTNDRTRFFGRSHWALTLDMFPDLTAHLQQYQVKKEDISSEFREYLSTRRMKQAMRRDEIFHTQIDQSLQPTKLEDMIPARGITDHLVNLYFSSFEGTFRVLHVPHFLAELDEYWRCGGKHPGDAFSSEVFSAKLLALMSSASCFYGELAAVSEMSHRSLNQKAKSWIQAVVLWIKSMTSYNRLRLDIIQTKCLLLLARHSIGYEGDLAWLSTGSLLRDAVTMGLHRDPSNFPGVSHYWAEIRKRLWLTVVELELQAALSNGTPLAISEDEFDCCLPSNVDDECVTTSLSSSPQSQPLTVFTRTSFQIILAQSLSTRFQIAKVVNRVRFTLDYKEMLDLSESLTMALSNNMPTSQNSGLEQNPTQEFKWSFQQSLSSFLVYRSLLALHRPFFLDLEEKRNDMYLYSRKICVEASMALLDPLKSFLEDLDAGPAHWSHSFKPSLPFLKGGMFRDDIFHAAVTICFELRLQAQDKSLRSLAGSAPGLLEQITLHQRVALIKTVEKAIKYFELKVRTEKQACKAFMFLHMVFTSAKNQLLLTNRHLLPGDEHLEIISLEDACPTASRLCRELLMADGSDLSFHGSSTLTVRFESCNS